MNDRTIQEARDEWFDDVISRAAAIEAIRKLSQSDGYIEMPHEFVTDAIRALPSAQPETAKLIVGKSRDGMTLWYQCDMCNEPVDEQDNFCRGCGRRLIDE